MGDVILPALDAHDFLWAAHVDVAEGPLLPLVFEKQVIVT